MLLQMTMSKEVEALGAKLKEQKLQRRQTQMTAELKEIQLSNLISRLREAVKEENLGQVRLDDDFLTIFLRVRDYNLESALVSFRNYYRTVHNNHDRFRGSRPSDSLSVYEDQIIQLLKRPCKMGTKVAVVRVKSWDPNKHSISALLNTAFFLIQEAILQERTQLYGLSIVLDLKNLSLSQLRQITPKDLKLLVTCAQGGLPVRIVAVHFINYPSIFWGVFYIAQGFMKEKMRKRMHFHSNLTSMLQHFNVDSIPTWLGGAPDPEVDDDDDAIDKELVDRVLKNDKEFEEYFEP